MPQDFGFGPDRLAHGGIIFALVRESLRNAKETCGSQESFEKLCTKLRPHIQKNKTRFADPILVEKQVAAASYYLADEGRMLKVVNSFGI